MAIKDKEGRIVVQLEQSMVGVGDIQFEEVLHQEIQLNIEETGLVLDSLSILEPSQRSNSVPDAVLPLPEAPLNTVEQEELSEQTEELKESLDRDKEEVGYNEIKALYQNMHKREKQLGQLDELSKYERDRDVFMQIMIDIQNRQTQVDNKVEKNKQKMMVKVARAKRIDMKVGVKGKMGVSLGVVGALLGGAAGAGAVSGATAIAGGTMGYIGGQVIEATERQKQKAFDKNI